MIILCDTNGGTLPDEIVAGVAQARRALRVEVGIHCHNDCDVAVANSLAAIAAGVTHVQGTINGIGERCGNADLVSILANLALKRGHEVLRPGSLQHLTEASRYVYEIANMNFRSNQPFVGASAFAHSDHVFDGKAVFGTQVAAGHERLLVGRRHDLARSEGCQDRPWSVDR